MSYRLLAGKDPGKDQSYFLCQLTQDQLAKALFPIGELLKSEVRALAREAGLATADKKDSQGLCFIGKVHLPDFLQQRLEPRKGNIIRVEAGAPVYAHANGEELRRLAAPFAYTPDQGTVVGEHSGAHFYTIGQRKGLHLGGFKEPLFVIATDTTQNVVYTGMGEQHPGLFRKGLFVPSADAHWVRPDLALATGENARYMARIRYRQPLEPVTLYQEEEGLYLIFDRPQKAITPGQFAAWYTGEELIGSGVIA
jgi:tRNA-specific 2-thiouridylase